MHKATAKTESTETKFILNLSCTPKLQAAAFEANGNKETLW